VVADPDFIVSMSDFRLPVLGPSSSTFGFPHGLCLGLYSDRWFCHARSVKVDVFGKRCSCGITQNEGFEGNEIQ